MCSVYIVFCSHTYINNVLVGGEPPGLKLLVLLFVPWVPQAKHTKEKRRWHRIETRVGAKRVDEMC